MILSVEPQAVSGNIQRTLVTPRRGTGWQGDRGERLFAAIPFEL